MRADTASPAKSSRLSLVGGLRSLQRDDDLHACPVGLTLPGLGGAVERDTSRCRPRSPRQACSTRRRYSRRKHFARRAEVREAEDVQLLAADVRRQERGSGPGRLTDVARSALPGRAACAAATRARPTAGRRRTSGRRRRRPPQGAGQILLLERDTASAPSRRARSSTSGRRPAATTRDRRPGSGPPVAPRARPSRLRRARARRRPLRPGARAGDGSQPASPAIPSAPASAGSTPSGSGTITSSGTDRSSASAPSAESPCPRRAPRRVSRRQGLRLDHAAHALAARNEGRKRAALAVEPPCADVDVDRVQRHRRDPDQRVAANAHRIGRLADYGEAADSVIDAARKRRRFYGAGWVTMSATIPGCRARQLAR